MRQRMRSKRRDGDGATLEHHGNGREMLEGFLEAKLHTTNGFVTLCMSESCHGEAALRIVGTTVTRRI